MPKRSRAKKLMEKANDNIGKIAGIVSGLVVIIGALTGTIGWLNSQLRDAIATQINEFRQEAKASDDAQNLAIMRLELMNLIQNDPENVVEIEMLGKKYFQSGGNSYVSRYFSSWAKEYGGDASIVVGDK